ncbi:MAG: ABC-type transport system (lipoprotein release) permease component [Bacteroidetes bacterium]|nr:MAG: ABC-type transport system (lipoprotein release) permease component [Bacteroidota bacterium]
MLLTINLAIINLMRNKKRSFFVIASIVVGITGGLLGVSIGNGYVNQLVNSVIRFETADVLIHENTFFDQMEPSAFLKNSDQLIKSVNLNNGINALTARIKINGYIRSALSSANVEIIGVDPKTDRLVFPIHEAIHTGKGNYFTDYNRIPIVMGNLLADQLGVNINSRLVLSGQTKNGDLFSSVFWVCGIYSVDNKLFEKKSVFVLLDEIAVLSGFKPDEVHEIAIKLDKNIQSSDHIVSALESQHPGLKISKWPDIRPEIFVTKSYINLTLNILISIILFAISIGIINIMILVVYERRREFGMLRALGMNKVKIFQMIMFEIIFLLLISLFISTLINFTVLSFLSQNGVPVWSVEGVNMLGVGTVDRIYPVLRWQQLIFVTGLIILLSFLSSIIPTLKVLGIHPTEAMKN